MSSRRATVETASALWRSRPVLVGFSLLAALVLAAPVTAGGSLFYTSSRLPSPAVAACTIGRPSGGFYYAPSNYRPQGYRGGGHHSPYNRPRSHSVADNGPTVSYESSYTDSYGETTSLEYSTGYYDKSTVESERRRQERLRDEDRARQDRIVNQMLAERAEDRREARAYRPPPAEDYEIAIHGYGEQSFESVVDSTLARNQSEARSANFQPTPTPEAVQGMTLIGVGDDQYYYVEGRFYVLDADDNVEEVEAPEGAMVFSLPKDRETLKAGGLTYYVYNDTYYTRLQVMGRLVYKVMPNPEG